MEKKYNAVVVGCGAIGPVHAQVLQHCEGAQLYGVCDILPERAEYLAKQQGCKVFAKFEMVLADKAVDVVHICTPHYLHMPMAIEAGQWGKHLVIEKPMAMNRKEADKLQRHLSASSTKACCILQNRYTPCVEAMKQEIDSGKYGAVKGGRGLLTWQRTAEYYQSASWRGRWATEGGGLLINQAVHLLDLLTYLGGKCHHIQGNIANRTLQGIIEVEDTAEATLYTEAGSLLHFFATNGYCDNTPFDVEIVLEKATLRFMDGKLFLRQNGETEEIVSNQSPAVGKTYWGNGHWKLIQNFYWALQGKKFPYTGVKEGAEAVCLVDAIYQSAKEKKPIYLL